MFYIGIK